MECDPCRYIMADMSREKHNLHLNQYSTRLYDALLFSEIIVAIHLKKILALLPIPPNDEKTSGVF